MFYKVLGYGCLYKSYGDTVDAISLSEVTLSIVREEKPVELLKRFRNEGNRASHSAGVYYIKNQPFPVQIIVGKELPDDEYRILKALTRKLKKDSAKDLVANATNVKTHYEKELIDAVLQVAMSANRETFDLLKKEEAGMCEAMRELMKPEIDQAISEAVSEAVSGERKDRIRKKLRKGKTPQQIHEDDEYSLDLILTVQKELMAET